MELLLDVVQPLEMKLPPEMLQPLDVVLPLVQPLELELPLDVVQPLELKLPPEREQPLEMGERGSRLSPPVKLPLELVQLLELMGLLRWERPLEMGEWVIYHSPFHDFLFLREAVSDEAVMTAGRLVQVKAGQLDLVEVKERQQPLDVLWYLL